MMADPPLAAFAGSSGRGTPAIGHLRLEGLGKDYAGVTVVDGLTLSVEPGEFCVVLGPSGSGKSTLINMIGGFTAPSRGEIFVDRSPTSGLPPHKRDFGMMFQGYALFPHLSVFENVAFPLRARGCPGAEVGRRVGEMLATVELQALADRLPQQLSGGQQQRVALARALVFRPRLALMDEPLAALDRRLRDRMQAEIKRIQRKLGITVVYITHDQEEALTLADKLVVMNGGKAEQVGSPLDVYHHPRTRFVCEFLGESNLIEASVVSYADGVAVCAVGGGAHVRIASGRPLTPGARVAVSVRPQRMRFVADPAPDANRLQGQITEIVDVGSSRRYRIGVEGIAKPLLVLEQDATGGSGRSEGETVVIGFSAGDAVLVDD